MASKDYETSEGAARTSVETVEDAHRLHHLATADPEPERDGLLTGPAHEKKYGLERADASADQWRASGVHPFENRALRPGDEGYDDAVAAGNVAPLETADAPRASDSK